MSVGQLGESVQQVALCCGCGTVGGECAAGGFVLWVWDSWGRVCSGWLCVVSGTFGAVSVQQVALCCV